MSSVSLPAFTVLLATLTGGADTNQPDRVIRVSGEGVATVPPDMATISTGVVTRATSATEAVAANSKAMKDVLASLKKLDVPADDIQTTDFNVQPTYKHDEHGRTLEITGYEVSNQLRVHVRKLGNLGKILDVVVNSGSNRISGITFGVSNPKATRDAARRQAVADARHRAEVMAREAGVKVGRVISIQEQGTYRPQPRFEARALAQDAAVPVATGRKEFRVTVQLVFAIAEEPATAAQPIEKGR